MRTPALPGGKRKPHSLTHGATSCSRQVAGAAAEDEAAARIEVAMAEHSAQAAQTRAALDASAAALQVGRLWFD